MTSNASLSARYNRALRMQLLLPLVNARLYRVAVNKLKSNTNILVSGI